MRKENSIDIVADLVPGSRHLSEMSYDPLQTYRRSEGNVNAVHGDLDPVTSSVMPKQILDNVEDRCGDDLGTAHNSAPST